MSTQHLGVPWLVWLSADVSTAFLQGLPQERKLWVRLPADAARLLSRDEAARMFLHKPVCGQLDAPKRWFLEATRRLRTLNWRPHPLDPCLRLLYEPADGSATPVLCGLLCLHVDDMLGTGNPASSTYAGAEDSIKSAFNFRTWQKDEPFEYCGAKMTRDPDGTWHIRHKDYLTKISPLPLNKSRQPHQPMTDKEQTMLRGLLGSLQWPAVQSSPHLQASTSLLSGEMSIGLSSPMLEANKLLRFAKANSDVHLSYPPLGALSDLRITCMFDAALGVGHDGASQGGYITMLTHKDALNGIECPYSVLDWRSFRLPRVARSSLAAEVQSAAQAVDSTEFVVRFWQMILNPNLSLKDTLAISDTSLTPTFITGAKALYDSFHRDAINHGAADKRTNLELRVIREQVESIGGVLKWISSERQFGDGFTKVSAKQLLADRLRRLRQGSIKFTFDPGYTASKKKTAAQRAESRNEFTAGARGQADPVTEDIFDSPNGTNALEPVTNKDHELIEGNLPDESEIFQNDTALVNDSVPVECYARSCHGARLWLKYVLPSTLVVPSLGEARCHFPTSTSSDDLLQLGILLTLIVLGCLAVFRARQPPELPPAAPELVDDNQAPEVPTPTSSASSDFHEPHDEDDGLFDHADTQLLVENAHLLGSVIQLQDEMNVLSPDHEASALPCSSTRPP